METKQVPIDGGLHFDVEVQDDGHVYYFLETGNGKEPLAQYCPDTKELTLFEVTSERQATDVVRTQLNHTTDAILGSDVMRSLQVTLVSLLDDEPS